MYVVKYHASDCHSSNLGETEYQRYTKTSAKLRPDLYVKREAQNFLSGTTIKCGLIVVQLGKGTSQSYRMCPVLGEKWLSCR
jgi:hypothetical protein